MKLSELARAIALAITFLVLQTVIDNVSLSRWLTVALIFVVLLALLLYCRELMKSIDLAEMYIMAHLLMISNAGIDPETTPVWHKRKMFERLQICVIGYAVTILVQLAVEIFVPGVEWVHRMMQDISELAILIGLGIVYKLRGGNRQGFTLIEDVEDGLMLADIELVDTPQPLRKGGRKWEQGMILPPPPGTSQANASLTLEAPDGVFELSARVEEPETV
jgi:hypothetical protein